MKYRYNAITNEPIELHYYSLDNGALYDIFQWVKVEIYDQDPSQGSPSPIQIITSTGIVRVGLGHYKYVMDPVLTGNKYYYDKQYYIPKEGQSLLTDIEKVYVRDSYFEGAPLPVDITTIYGTIYDIGGKPLSGTEVIATVLEVPLDHESLQITFGLTPIKTLTDESGQFYLNLAKGLKVKLTIPIIGYSKEVYVPTDTDSVYFRAL